MANRKKTVTAQTVETTDVEECIYSESDTDDDTEPEGNDPIEDAYLDKRENVWANVD